jgi:hypothetical protein
MLRMLAVFGLFVCLSVGHATTPHEAACAVAFQDVFDKTWAGAEVCDDNVRKLLVKFKDEVPGFDMSEAKVLVIYDQKGRLDRNAIDPVEQRELDWREQADGSEPGPVRWNYHVVVAYGGKIYDTDYKAEPTVVPEAQYFEDMYFLKHQEDELVVAGWKRQGKSNAERLEDLRVREIPATVYLDEFYKNDLRHNIRHGNHHDLEPRFPSSPLADRIPNAQRLANPPKRRE